MTPSGPVRMGITPLAQQPCVLSDGRDSIIVQRVITVSYNAGILRQSTFFVEALWNWRNEHLLIKGSEVSDFA